MFYDPDHDVVVYDSKNPDLLAMTRGGKELPYNGFKAIPASLYNLQVASYLGFNVPPVMLIKNYDYPRDRRAIPIPWKSQLISSNFLALHPRAFDLSDMGTGKTLAALWAADFVMLQNEPGSCRCLIVAPLSTLERVWKDAIFQNLLKRRRAVILYGSANKRRELLREQVDFYIVNYDGLPILEDALAQRPDIRMCIVDEASAYKDRTTQRHRLGRQLYASKDYLWELTGTPTPNAPTDAWGLAKLVNNCHGETFNNFMLRTMYQTGKWRWLPRQGAHEAAHKLMQPSVRFAIEDCHDLPPCTYQLRDVPLTHDQAAAYKELKKTAMLMVKGGVITAVNEAVMQGKLMQICCGAVYGSDPDRTVHKLDCKPRIDVLHEVIRETRQKIIVFAPFTSVVNILHSELRKNHSCAMITGATSAKERAQIFGDFQSNGNPRIIVADPGTMSHGLTLTAATVIVWFSPTNKTEQYLQSNKRIDRPGQRYPTTIIQLASTTIEREVYRRLEANESMMGLTLMLAREESSHVEHPKHRRQ